jgi:hypothetical protein
MNAMAEEPAPPERDEPHGVELWLAPFFRDSTLWPVLVTAAAIFIVLGASALLLAFERNPFAVAAVLVMLWISADAGIRGWRAGGSRLLLGSIAGFWLLSTAAAIAARWSGWF